MIVRLLAVILAATATMAGATPRRLPPTDTCSGDAAFVTFRNRLRQAVAHRDVAALLSLASDDIAITVTGNVVGKAAFARVWRLDRPATSPLWHELGTALALGCGHDNQGFLWAPALRGDGMGDAIEPNGLLPLVAIGPAAVLKARPSAASATIARLRWDVVAPASDDRRSTWMRVSLPDGRRGFVRRDQVRSIGDYSALFELRHGRWQMISFSSDIADDRGR